MALLAVEELLASREAIAARVDVDEEQATLAIAEAEALLRVVVGFSPEEKFDEGDPKRTLSVKFVRIAAVRALQSTRMTGGLPAPSGALLTGFSSESAQFTFFTPSGESTGYADLDRLAALIKGRGALGLRTITITTGPITEMWPEEYDPFGEGWQP